MRARMTALLAALVLALWLSPAGAAHAWTEAAVWRSGAEATQTAGEEAEQTGGPAQDAEQTQAPAEAAERLRGTLRGPDREPVVGLTVTATQGGAEVATGTTDDRGQWEIPLPGPGTYDVSYDPAGLPEGVGPAAEGGEVVSGVIVRPGATQGVVFQLAGEGEDGASGGGGPSWLPRFVQLLVQGINFGAIIAITAVGLSLVFGTTRLINFAHGEYVTLGAVVAFYLSGAGGLPLVLAAVLAMAAVAAFSGGVELALWRPMRRKGTGLIQMFIVAIGLALLVRHVILVVFGSRRRQYDEYNLQPAWDLGLFRITPRDLVITVLSFAVMGLVALMLQRTRMGKAMRAVNDNKDLAQASGIDVERVVLVVWLLGGGLAGLGGVFYGLTQSVYPEMGFTLLLMMFAGVILGGLGSAYGAMLGALVIGVVSQLSILWFPASLQFMWALLVMILVLLFRPQGILGRRERVG